MQAVDGKRLDKLIVLTGGAGELGRETALLLLSRGARVVLTGRNEGRLREAVVQIKAEFQKKFGVSTDSIDFVAMDGADPGAVSRGAKIIYERYGRIDVLINNAGSAGPKCVVREIPLSRNEGESIAPHEETLEESCGSLVGSVWLTTKAFFEILNDGASIVNVSTIFSKTPYFGRSAYVVPKAALNALSRRLARDLGADQRRIRVNTVLPGPIESDRIRNVFAAMDRLQGSEAGKTRDAVLGRMLLRGGASEGEFVRKQQVADVITFLSSDESSAFTGHEFEVTNGLKTPRRLAARSDSGPEIVFNETGKYFDGATILIFARRHGDDALDFAARFARRGAHVKLLVSPEETPSLRIPTHSDGHISIEAFEPVDNKHWIQLESSLAKGSARRLALALVLGDDDQPEESTLEMSFSRIKDCVQEQVVRKVAIAKGLDRICFSRADHDPGETKIIFLSAKTDSEHEPLDLEASATHALIRVWNDELRTETQIGRRVLPPSLQRIFRSSWHGGSNLELTWSRIASACISSQVHHDGPANSGHALIRDELGLHLGKVALITGGSEGIGGEITRQLLMAGAMVVVAERSTEKLERAWTRLTEQLRKAGFLEPEKRLLLIPNSDVTKPNTLDLAIEKALKRFGRVDFVINNAGLVGAEKMVVDLPEDVWRQTLQGNLISNYQLMKNALGQMRVQGHGHIINMSSYFGGSRHGHVAYTNRADYAVSKAAQQAMATELAKFVGPDVQWNAIAPGPVDGARLNGTNGAPGLYMRRAKLIREGKRLNRIYAAVIAAVLDGESVERMISALAKNEIAQIIADERCPKTLGEVCKNEGLSDASAGGAARWLLTRPMFEVLVQRLSRTPGSSQGLRVYAVPEFHEPSGSFWDETLISREATAIRDEMCERFTLKRMPTDKNLAKEVVSALAHRTVTGEVIFPTCGFLYEGFKLGRTFRSDGAEVPQLNESSLHESLREVRARKVYIFAGAMLSTAVEIATRIHGGEKDESGPGRLVIVTNSSANETRLREMVSRSGLSAQVSIHFQSNASMSEAFHAVESKHGKPDIVFSLPMGDLKFADSDVQELPSTAKFAEIVEEQITNHFVIAKCASLVPNCRVALITPTREETKSSMGHALIEFIRFSLRPLTIAAGREASFLPQRAVFYQIDFDRADQTFYGNLIALAARKVEVTPAATKVQKKPRKGTAA